MSGKDNTHLHLAAVEADAAFHRGELTARERERIINAAGVPVPDDRPELRYVHLLCAGYGWRHYAYLPHPQSGLRDCRYLRHDETMVAIRRGEVVMGVNP